MFSAAWSSAPNFDFWVISSSQSSVFCIHLNTITQLVFSLYRKLC